MDSDGLRHRPSTPLSDSELVEPVEDDCPDSIGLPDKDVALELATQLKWCPLISTVCLLVYFHGAALGWYLCSK